MFFFFFNFLLVFLYVYIVQKTWTIDSITYRHIGFIEEFHKFFIFLFIYYTSKNKDDIKSYLTSTIQFSIIETILRITYWEWVWITLFLFPIKTAIHIMFTIPTLIAWRINKKLIPIGLLIGWLLHWIWDILCINHSLLIPVLSVIIVLTIYFLIYLKCYFQES